MLRSTSVLLLAFCFRFSDVTRAQVPLPPNMMAAMMPPGMLLQVPAGGPHRPPAPLFMQLIRKSTTPSIDPECEFTILKLVRRIFKKRAAQIHFRLKTFTKLSNRITDLLGALSLS